MPADVDVFGVALVGLLLTGGAGGVEVMLAASVAALIGFPFAMPDTQPPPRKDE